MKIPSRTRRVVVTAFAAAWLSISPLLASEQIPPPGAIPCEADWMNSSHFDSISTVSALRYLEADAERGDMAARLRLGLVRSTADRQWIAPKDSSYNIPWLEKAELQGSLSATWELAKIRQRQLGHETYLAAAMNAAEKEGNPWAASYLMFLTSGRLGSKHQPTQCAAPWTVDGKCAPDAMLPVASARKWAEIAAEGGNAYAQEWLCWAAAEGAPDRGQPQDDRVALKWCQMATHHACSSSAGPRVLMLLDKGVTPSVPTAQEVARIRQMGKQPWRNSRHFYVPRD